MLRFRILVRAPLRKSVEQQMVEKNVASTDLLQQNQIGHVMVRGELAKSQYLQNFSLSSGIELSTYNQQFKVVSL